MKGEIRMKKVLLGLITAVCGIIFAYSAWKLYGSYSSYEEAKTTYQKLRKQTVKKDPNRERKINFNQLEKINPDVIGWIYVPGTKIDYPIVQGKDNEEYLHKTFDGENNNSGTIFMDKNGTKDFTADNNLIYGHHMKNGTMFADLLKFREKSFVEKSPYIFLVTPDRTRKLRVISAYANKAQGSIPIIFADQQSRQQYLNTILDKSEVSVGISGKTKKEIKKIYTFVTCSYEKENYRTFVHAAEESGK